MYTLLILHLSSLIKLVQTLLNFDINLDYGLLRIIVQFIHLIALLLILITHYIKHVLEIVDFMM